MSWTACPEPDNAVPTCPESVRTVVVPRAVDLGGIQVRRVLPSRAAQMIGPFIFFDQMGPAHFAAGSGLDVRPHPHINLATLTYLLDGEILHRDSLGNRQRITPGAVNWMRAGAGIVHSERSSDERRATDQSLLGTQIWVALPEPAEESEPQFVHHGADAIPVIDDTGLQARLIAGEAYGSRSPLQTESAMVCVDATLAAHAQLPVPDEYAERAIYIIDGELDVGGECFTAGKLLILAPHKAIVVRAVTNTRMMLFGGEPMDGPRYISWNFVSSRAERIEQARDDWREGRFASIPGDDEEFIPLPADTKPPRRIAAGSEPGR